MRKFFVNAEDIGTEFITVNNRDDLHHMLRVLRLGDGDEVIISDKEKWEYDTKIVSIDSDEAVLKIIDKQAFASEPSVKVTLIQGIPKKGKMDLIVQKSVELGVNRIIPVFMQRTVVVDKGNFDKKIQRWNRISEEAVKQCKRGIIPHVGNAVKSADMPEILRGYDLILFPYENEDTTTIKDVLRNLGVKPLNVALVIGPEGGFSEEEAEMVIGSGGKSCSLGRIVLRTETAGMAALAMVMYELEL